MEFVLNRSYYRGGTNGTLTLNGKFICFVLELPWADNDPMKSCIPEGRYSLKTRYTQRFGDHLCLKGVKGRCNILMRTGIHLAKDTKGALLPISQLSGIGEGVFSRIALQKILARIEWAININEEIIITIES